jgi:peptidoglycan/xylan/chitin deacetylase (PgdA/CDA1 family)
MKLNNNPIMRLIQSLLWVSLLLLSVNAFAAKHCVILQYHHFSEKTPASTSVTPKQFTAHLEYLAQNEFSVMPLRDVVLSLHHQLDLPEKCVSLTVDDAYQSVYTEAWPLLKPYGYHMTIFVNSESVDKGQQPYMSWAQMRELSRNGFGFENHGHSHRHMIRKLQNETELDWLKRVGMDIRIAQKRISEEIDIEPVLFAFPYGEYTPELQRLIEKLGFSGFGQQSGPAWPDASATALPDSRWLHNMPISKVSGSR